MKKKREFIERSKLCLNYKDIYSSLIPYLNKDKIVHKSKEYFTDRDNNSKLSKNKSLKILNNNNNFMLSIPTLPSIDKFNNHKNNNSFDTSITNRIINLSNNDINTNMSNNNNIALSDRNQIRLFNKKLKKKKLLLSNSSKNFIEINDKDSSINNNNNILDGNEISNENITSINNINKKQFNSIIASYNQKILRRNNSSFLIGNNENINIIKKCPMQLSKYKKKWNLPKSIIFDKIAGRYDNKSKKKFLEIQGITNYFPNYNSIFIDNKKSYVNYGKNKDKILKNLKIDTTRKLISNLHNLLNSSINSYKVMDIIEIDKKKKKEEKINKLKEKFGQYYEMAFKIKK